MAIWIADYVLIALQTGNRIETVLKENRNMKNTNWHKKKRRADKRIVDMVAKRMAEHNVGAVQKTVRQARKKALAPSASAFLPLMNSGDASAFLPPRCIIVDEVGVMG